MQIVSNLQTAFKAPSLFVLQFECLVMVGWGRPVLSRFFAIRTFLYGGGQWALVSVNHSLGRAELALEPLLHQCEGAAGRAKPLPLD